MTQTTAAELPAEPTDPADISRALDDLLLDALRTGQMRETLHAQDLTELAVMEESVKVLNESSVDFRGQVAELLHAERARNVALGARSGTDYDLAGGQASRSIEAERLRSDLREQLRSLVVVPAIERAQLPRFAPPLSDIVHLAGAPALTSRVKGENRIQTSSYREVLPHLVREGGTTIGLAGSRGVGKSELLRAFCEEAEEKASIEKGRTIGIIIPAPVAYDPAQFLRVLIRRLAEAVPGYAPRFGKERPPVVSVPAAVAILASAVLVAVGAWLAAAIALRGRSVDVEAARINQRLRASLGLVASEVAQRIRYVESRSVEKEGSATVHSLGSTYTSGMNLAQVPLTEPDLVAELTTFVSRLSSGGYRIRIGIDELDKLVDGDDAEKFLTGMKNLFTIRECSFLLTVSENAAAQFARRGMPIRDVFDSSLDAVISVRPLTYQEAKRLVNGRLRGPGAYRRLSGGARAPLAADTPESMSDSQILFCHCMAGGLPREFLRYCRQLGGVNASPDSPGSLDVVSRGLLHADLLARVEGIRAAVAAQGSWMTYAQRQLAVYVYFVETAGDAFGPDSVLARQDTDQAAKVITLFEVLTEARRRIEIDSAAGWRAISDARQALGLNPVELA